MLSRSGQLLSPHARIPIYLYVYSLVPLLFDIFLTIGGMLSFIIPERRGTKLPETIEETDKLEKPDCC
ncbi:hypothetical protein LSH36_3g24059 [Paralvinella palmiformis]|uniref:Uncharacterized protein n=1 Tax=Paralvinella palmiformis TaxID=53620 RepID=A0AAD9KFU1_9ANNE|nr:hypothetical protein LSH36_3g24059 [Paralvinella palmiformis]